MMVSSFQVRILVADRCIGLQSVRWTKPKKGLTAGLWKTVMFLSHHCDLISLMKQSLKWRRPGSLLSGLDRRSVDVITSRRRNKSVWNQKASLCEKMIVLSSPDRIYHVNNTGCTRTHDPAVRRLDGSDRRLRCDWRFIVPVCDTNTVLYMGIRIRSDRKGADGGKYLQSIYAIRSGLHVGGGCSHDYRQEPWIIHQD